MKFSAMHVLYFQIGAALFMGADYLIPKKWRNSLEKRIIGFLTHLHKSINVDIKKSIEVIQKNKTKLTLSFILIITTMIAPILLKSYTGSIAHQTQTIALVLSMLFWAIGVILVFSIMAEVISEFTFGIAIASLAIYLIRNEKGPIAGFGFILLLTSFAMRWANIK